MAGSILTVFFGFFTASGSAFVRAILDESEDRAGIVSVVPGAGWPRDEAAFASSPEGAELARFCGRGTVLTEGAGLGPPSRYGRGNSFGSAWSRSSGSNP